MTWNVVLTDEVEAWLLGIDDDSYDMIAAAIDKLEQDGPTLGRPLVDRIKGSSLHNLKELRPGSTGRSEIRTLFAFDPVRRATLLVGGDKAGRWSSWYESAIPLVPALDRGR